MVSFVVLNYFIKRNTFVIKLRVYLSSKLRKKGILYVVWWFWELAIISREIWQTQNHEKGMIPHAVSFMAGISQVQQ